MPINSTASKPFILLNTLKSKGGEIRFLVETKSSDERMAQFLLSEGLMVRIIFKKCVLRKRTEGKYTLSLLLLFFLSPVSKLASY